MMATPDLSLEEFMNRPDAHKIFWYRSRILVRESALLKLVIGQILKKMDMKWHQKERFHGALHLPANIVFKNGDLKRVRLINPKDPGTSDPATIHSDYAAIGTLLYDIHTKTGKGCGKGSELVAFHDALLHRTRTRRDHFILQHYWLMDASKRSMFFIKMHNMAKERGLANVLMSLQSLPFGIPDNLDPGSIFDKVNKNARRPLYGKTFWHCVKFVRHFYEHGSEIIGRRCTEIQLEEELYKRYPRLMENIYIGLSKFDILQNFTK